MQVTQLHTADQEHAARLLQALTSVHLDALQSAAPALVVQAHTLSLHDCMQWVCVASHRLRAAPSRDLGSEWWYTQRTFALSMPIPKATVAARMRVLPSVQSLCTKMTCLQTQHLKPAHWALDCSTARSHSTTATAKSKQSETHCRNVRDEQERQVRACTASRSSGVRLA